MKTAWVGAGSLACVLYGLAMPASGNAAAVTEDEFLLRTTGDLVELCKATATDPLYTAAVNFCHGFTVGVYRVLEEESNAQSTRQKMYCLPDAQPRRNEGIAAFIQWAEANSDQKNQPPTDGIAAFLRKTYPCVRGKK